MRYKDLIQESLVGSENGVRDMLQTVIMSLSASDMDEIPTSMIAQELKAQMNIDVPYGKLMDLLNQMPVVQTATADSVVLQGSDDVEQDPADDAKDRVAQMATSGASATKSF